MKVTFTHFPSPSMLCYGTNWVFSEVISGRNRILTNLCHNKDCFTTSWTKIIFIYFFSFPQYVWTEALGGDSDASVTIIDVVPSWVCCCLWLFSFIIFDILSKWNENSLGLAAIKKLICHNLNVKHFLCCKWWCLAKPLLFQTSSHPPRNSLNPQLKDIHTCLFLKCHDYVICWAVQVFLSAIIGFPLVLLIQHPPNLWFIFAAVFFWVPPILCCLRFFWVALPGCTCIPSHLHFRWFPSAALSLIYLLLKPGDSPPLSPFLANENLKVLLCLPLSRHWPLAFLFIDQKQVGDKDLQSLDTQISD